jgi:hypothetical protein
VKGKIGNTTDTFYPVAGANSPADGWTTANDDPWQKTWAQIITENGTNSFPSDSAGYVLLAGASNVSRWQQITVIHLMFDTSALGTDTVDSGTLSQYGTAKSNNFNSAYDPKLGLIISNPANTNNIVNADHQTRTKTRQCDTDITYAGFNAAGYNNFTLNTAGKASVNKTGVSKFALTNGSDIDNADPGNQANKIFQLSFYMADQTGTTNDPKLVVVHTAVATATSEESNLIIFE